MSTQSVGELVRWQDLKVRSELDIVLEIAREQGWEDCEIFGYGDMITEPQESKGWKLIPADLYEDSIPPEAVGRLHQIINAGIRVRGVIIADDERRMEPVSVPAVMPAPEPARPRISLVWARRAVSWASRALLGLVHAAGAVLTFSGRALLVLLKIAAVGSLVALGIYALLQAFWVAAGIGFVIFLFACAGSSTGTSAGSNMSYDPKLVILVDDGSGGTTWVSLFTWYD